jgi:hypothetical protein
MFTYITPPRSFLTSSSYSYIVLLEVIKSSSTYHHTSIKMEKAKAAVGNFLSKDGKHDTTIHEVNMPPNFH